MIIKDIIDEDYDNYKEISMVIVCPYCSGKCYKELGVSADMCHNTSLKSTPNIDVPTEKIVERYLSNSLTSAICFGGLEPLEQAEDVLDLVKEFRKHTNDTVVLYTGYNADEHPVVGFIGACKNNNLNNIIMKVGRYRPNQMHRYEELLGVTLASNNQYAIKIS